MGVDPEVWQADPILRQKPLTEAELKIVATGCWFPVYAFGYNWLQSNGDSAKIIANRIDQVIADLCRSGYECNKVIVVTHSMGGLVGRALLHEKYGNLQDKILGVVHGVMPAIGAPAAYKRMRAGFEDPGLLVGGQTSLGAKVAGNYGDEVTAVLANSEGGLQLLPTEAYGNGWLRVTYNGRDLESWPKADDPYNEIYKVKGKWYSLFREDWINPSNVPAKKNGGSFKRTCEYLDKVRAFHNRLARTFHPNTYAHYGADAQRSSFVEVVWEIDQNCADPTGWQDWPIISDTRQGTLELVRWEATKSNKALRPYGDEMPGPIRASLCTPKGAGDQIVPAKSADYPMQLGALLGVFRQTGYEHQSSYENPRAIASTLFSIIRISQKAAWKR